MNVLRTGGLPVYKKGKKTVQGIRIVETVDKGGNLKSFSRANQWA